MGFIDLYKKECRAPYPSFPSRTSSSVVITWFDILRFACLLVSIPLLSLILFFLVFIKMPYVRTPPADRLRTPSAGELASYQTGPDRFVNLAALGGFQTFTVHGLDLTRFNCFAWSLGFTDRWIQGGTRDVMEQLCAFVYSLTAMHRTGANKHTTDVLYMFRVCSPNEAEVELYDIHDAPPTLTVNVPGRPARRGRPAVPPTTRIVANAKYGIMHAHRRGNPALDEAPGRGCSSKLAAGPLIAHNRFALCDVREWGIRNPQIMYGNNYQCWQRDPAVHPTFRGNEENQYPLPGHYPDDAVFASG